MDRAKRQSLKVGVYTTVGLLIAQLCGGEELQLVVVSTWLAAAAVTLWAVRE